MGEAIPGVNRYLIIEFIIETLVLVVFLCKDTACLCQTAAQAWDFDGKINKIQKNYRIAEILSSKMRSAGSHLTEPRVSLVSQAESACSFRHRDSDSSEHTKQCIVKWKAG